MRMDLWVGTYLNWQFNSEGERISFSRRKEAHLSSALFDPNAFTPNADHIIVARTLFKRQKAIILEKGKHQRQGTGEKRSGRRDGCAQGASSIKPLDFSEKI